jgi:uncharacterized protein YcbK (DUF882 family)
MTDLPFDLRASLDSQVFNRRDLANLPPLQVVHPEMPFIARRGFLVAAGAALFAQQAQAAGGPLVFSPSDGQDAEKESVSPRAGLKAGDTAAEPRGKGIKGEVATDFWERPRELWLRRHKTKEEIRVVYWKDGSLLSDGYWQACSLLRDRTANVMTAIDPVLLDVLRGVHGYYEAWNWRHPIVVTSGFRTEKTNAALATEGAAKNSMHLLGRAVDLFVPGIPPEHIARLGQYLQQGGVGFYPSRGFTHLDTGKLRTWRG